MPGTLQQLCSGVLLAGYAKGVLAVSACLVSKHWLSGQSSIHMQPDTPNTILKSFIPWHCCMTGQMIMQPHPLSIRSWSGGSWPSDKIERRLFWATQHKYLLFMKRSLVLAATIQLSPSARASQFDVQRRGRSLALALEPFAPARARHQH